MNLGDNHYLCATQNLQKYECPKCKYATHFKVHLAKHKKVCSRNQHYVFATQSLEKYSCPESQNKDQTNDVCQKCHPFYSDSLLLVMKHESGESKNVKFGKKGSIRLWWCCQHCPFVRRSRFQVKRHSEGAHFSRDVLCKCQYCGHQTKTGGGMRYHILSHHFTAENLIYECKPCGFKTRIKQNHRKHMSLHSNYKTLNCTKCSYVTKARYNLDRHVKTIHSAPEKIEWLKCDYCPFKTKWSGGLKRHLKFSSCNVPNPTKVRRFTTANPHKAFQCGHCSLTTKTKCNLKSHIIEKHLNPSRSYQCHLCSYNTFRKSSVEQHVVMVHRTEKIRKKSEKEKSFKCYECGFRTAKKPFLKKHMNFAHVAPDKFKWFECEYCFFQTRMKGNLTKHVKALHTAPEDVEWKKCRFCDYKAKKKVSVQCHLAKAHGDQIVA